MEQPNQVDVNVYSQALKNQRNAAQDEAAFFYSQTLQLQNEVRGLRDDIEKLKSGKKDIEG